MCLTPSHVLVSSVQGSTTLMRPTQSPCAVLIHVSHAHDVPHTDSAQVGVIIGSVAVLAVIAVMTVKAVNDNKKKAKATMATDGGSVLLIDSEECVTGPTPD